MAARNASRAMLQGIGFTQAAADEMYDNQGINSIEELRILDDDAVTTLCKTLRRPGGVDPNGAGVNPGVAVSARAEINLKLAVYHIKHQERVSRSVTYANATLVTIRKLTRQRDMENKSESVVDAPKIDPKDWAKTMEAIIEWLGTFRGVTGAPLSYTVRKNLEPAAEASDPSTNYSTLDEEMIARAPIVDLTAVGGVGRANENNGPFVDTFMIDRVEVWAKIVALFQPTEAWTYAKVGRSKKDGRKGYLAIYDHYLGPNNVDHLASAAEKTLYQLVYNGNDGNIRVE
eukprot:CAMPEP_0202448362 /NCGR_PEP_ID=MMETSP1360-20130828/7172_1 /ASSEMBLY_ACC=CAM_ASM_000848 /TAXON_ID=515479 /ORGANISM="Licmophora paradoxa, Strain CCMP2313" /LENGTH=287 /DNA_ID=CAMNT_0049065891 /DNA_START=408 /DNA_END=1272 /DNA_ORIENTATION=-